MIVAKPKKGTLFSLGLFIIICLGIASYTAHAMLHRSEPLWYQYVIVVILFPLGLALLARMIFGYKIIKAGKGRIEILFPVRFKTESHPVKEVERWKEHVVKTATGTYKEVDILFSDRKRLTLSYQEHTDYQQIIKYLKKKCGNKEVRS